MEHGASQSVKEQLQTEMTIKTEVEAAATSTLRTDSETKLNSLKPEPGLVHSVKSEPALLVKEEILEDGSHDCCEQQCVDATAALVSTGCMNEICSTSLDDLLNVKYESEDIDIGPTVLQHMDIHYTINKNVSAAAEENSIGEDCNEIMPGGGVKKGSAEGKSGDNKATFENCTQTTTEVDYVEAHMKSRLGLQILHECRHSSVKLKNNLVNNEFNTRKKLYHHDEKFAQSGNLTKEIHLSHKPFQCKICDARFVLRRVLTTHMRVHTGEKPYECDTCHKKFSQRGSLTSHMRVHTGEKPYKCDSCHAKFSQWGSLSAHMRVHTGEKPYKCNTCEAKFSQSSGLTTHMRVHTSEKPYECDACHAKFTQRSGLTTHMRIHTGEKPYKCETCYAKFTQKFDLTKHKRVHTGEKPFECDMCNAKFTQGCGLKTHMRVHTGGRPYECDTCHAKFGYRSNLTKHKRVHTGEKPYECGTCRAKFARRDNLISHMRIHTGNGRY